MSITKLTEFSRRIYDPYVPRFYARYDFFVPRPTLAEPMPAVMVSVRKAGRKLWYRGDLPEVRKMFRLSREEIASLADALAEARAIVAELQEAERQDLLARTLPELPELPVDDPT